MKHTIIDYFKKNKLKLLIIFAFIGINVYLLTVPSTLLGKIIDLLYNVELNRALIIKNVIYLLLAAILALITRLIWKVINSDIIRNFERVLKDKLFAHFVKINLTSIQNIKNGELMSYFVKDIGELRGFLYRALAQGTRMIFITIIAIFTMKNVNGKLTFVALCPIAITAVIIVILKRYVEKSFAKAQKYFTNLSEYVQESTDAIRTTKAYSGEINQYKKFVRKNNILRKSNIAVDIYSTLLATSVTMCFGFCYGLTILYGSKLVLNNTITIGEFVAFNGYIGMFLSPIMWLPGLIAKFKRAQISYKRLLNVFALEEENYLPSASSQEKSKMLELDPLRGNILINNLTYQYPKTLDTVLENITLNVKEGETIGIIGTIGSGKTTLMNLLLRLYPVKDNTIFIGGKDINSIDLEKLRNNICYLTQDNFLFSSTIKDNISLFKDDFSDEAVEESTKKAMLHDDLNNMTNGIHTVIGERGIDLSGGQKQRVVISRAFLNDSSILIFDDAFSALDNKTEEIILNNIKELTKNKTCFIISNRISDVKDADRIIVLDDGKIIEQGTHDELLEIKNGLYTKFYNKQSSKTNEMDEVLS